MIEPRYQSDRVILYCGDCLEIPPSLPERCIKAGCPEGGTVLDPFNGLGTTGLEALKLGCRYIGIELSENYAGISIERIRAEEAQGKMF